MRHIFQMAQETSNKMVHKKRHHFLAQFSIPFHMVWSVLLRVVAHKTTFWLVEILWQPIRSFYSMVFEATTRNKTEHTMWKGMENCARKWCLFLRTILFEVTWPFCKMCKDTDVAWQRNLFCLNPASNKLSTFLNWNFWLGSQFEKWQYQTFRREIELGFLSKCMEYMSGFWPDLAKVGSTLPTTTLFLIAFLFSPPSLLSSK